MLAQEIIRNKREGKALSQADIGAMVDGMLDLSVSEGQISALAMAIYFQGMNRQECVSLTQALQHSGQTLDWSRYHLPGPIVDKHSTGGVGDKVSLMLAPMLAACGAYVPMISGRGLGHTGGTLDKLESIPGYNCQPSIDSFQQSVQSLGCAIIGQTAQLAPADKKLYAIRDVTATVESIPLIVASILSKKLAAGLNALVLDIKTGNGAFARGQQMAEELASTLVEVAQHSGLPCSALVTDMSQTLGTCAGNAVEIVEVVRYLRGDHRDPRLHEVTLALGEESLVLSGLANNQAQARQQLNTVLDRGEAAERFARMIAHLGGPKDFIDRYTHYLPAAPVTLPVYLPTQNPSHCVQAVDVRALGNAIVELGGGRRRPQDSIDHRVGLSAVQAPGFLSSEQQAFALIHAHDQASAEQAHAQILNAITLGEQRPHPPALICQRLHGQAASSPQ